MTLKKSINLQCYCLPDRRACEFHRHVLEKSVHRKQNIIIILPANMIIMRLGTLQCIIIPSTARRGVIEMKLALNINSERLASAP